MPSTTMVHVRVDEKIKEDASATLAAMGMSVSDAVRMMLVRVAAEKALPFEVRVPNATTVKAMRSPRRSKASASVPRRHYLKIQASDVREIIRSTQFKRDVLRCEKREG